MRKRVVIGAIFATVAAVIFILSYNSIWIIDCITYQYNFATGERIKDIGDIFESQYVHYFSWNGRYVAHWLCQLFLALLGKGIFSAVNAMMYIVLIMLVMKLSSRDTVTIPRALTATCLVLTLCETEYIPPCQIGYIWMAVLVLAFLRIFFFYANSARQPFLLYPALVVFSIIAGNGQEAINIGVGGALIVYALMNIRSMTGTQWCMLAGFGIGGLFLCLSPASIGRTEEMATTPLYSLINFFLSLRVTYLLAIILTYKLLKRSITWGEFYRGNAFYVNIILILLIFNFMVGVGGNRQLFGIELASCILTVRIIKNHAFSTFALVLFSVVILTTYTIKYLEIRKSETTYNEISAKIAAIPNGPIFVDFPHFNPYLRAATTFRYGVYLDYALRTMRSEHGHDLFDMKPIRCYPTEVNKFMNGSVENRSFEYLPGEFVLMQSKEEPKVFTLHRSINIMGIRIPLAPHQVEFDRNSHLNNEEYNILYLPEILPIIKNERVTME